ncbi:hypothetical protein ACU6U9_12505 [Pseudomonas sp. HK3]
MTLNINTLKLDIQYLQDGAGLSDDEREQVETQLALFIKESLTRLNLIKLPQAIHDAERDGTSNITLQNMEIILPLIDANKFLENRTHYFKQNIEPNLDEILYDAIKLSANKGFDINTGTPNTALETIEVGGNWWQGLQQLLQCNTGPLTYSHSFNALYLQGRAVLPRLLNSLKDSKKIRDFLKIQLCQPHIYNRFYKWFRQESEWQQLIQGVFTKDASSDYDHSAALSYLKQTSLTDTQKKHLLKHYLELNIVTQFQSQERGQKILNLYIKMHQLLDTISDQNINKALLLNNVHQSLLMAQSDIWLKHCNNWMGVVMHQGVKTRDITALKNVLKRAKGSSWLELSDISKDASSHTLIKQASLNASLPYSPNIMRQLYQKALALLSAFNQFNGDLNALGWHLARIKVFLLGPGKALNKTLIMKLQTSLHILYESQQTQENELAHITEYLKTRVDQLLTELAILLQTDQDRLLLRPNQRIDFLLNTLNELMQSPWLALALKQPLDELVAELTGSEAKTVDGILLSSAKINVLKTLQEKISPLLQKWLACLPITFNAYVTDALIPSYKASKTQDPPTQEALTASPGHLWQGKQNLLNHLAKAFDTQKTQTLKDTKVNTIGHMAEQTLALKIFAIVGFRDGSPILQQDTADYLANPTEHNAKALLYTLEHSAPLLIKQNYNVIESNKIFKQEQDLQNKTQDILITLLGQLISPEYVSDIHSVSANHIKSGLINRFLNKQQLYQLLSQLIACLKSAQAASISKKIKKCLDALMVIKNQLKELDSGLTQTTETWWQPLAETIDQPDNRAVTDKNTHNQPIDIKTVKTLRSRLQLCMFSLQSFDSVLGLSRSHNMNNGFESMFTTVLQACEHLADVTLTQIFYETPDKIEPEHKHISANSAQAELKYDVIKWAECCLKFLKKIPKEKKAILPWENKKKLESLIVFMNQCMQLGKSSKWSANQLKTCQTALDLLVKPLTDKTASSLAPHELHDLIWSQDLSNTLARLKAQPQSFLAAKKCERLLSDHRQKIQALIPKAEINDICADLKESLTQLKQTQEQQGANQISLDGGLVLIWPYLKDFFKNNQLIQSH